MFKKRAAVNAIIGEYIDKLKELGITADSIILFGSYAKGKNEEYSDIDLAVISKDFSNMDLRQRMEILGIAAARIMKPIEAMGYTPDEVRTARSASFLKEIIQTGIAM